MSFSLVARAHAGSRPRGRGVGRALAALLVLAAAPPCRAEATTRSTTAPARIGDLAGTPGEAEEGYPYDGVHGGGEVEIMSFVSSSFQGSTFELQRDDSIPRSLILQRLAGWAGRDGRFLLELDWDAPTELDTHFRGRYRDFRNFDLGYERDEFFWYDRPREQRSTRHRDLFTARLRKWGGLDVALRAEDASVRRLAMDRDRTASWNRVDLAAQSYGLLRGEGRAVLTNYTSTDNPAESYEESHLRLTMGRDIGPNTHLRAALDSRERTLDFTGETLRDLTLSLSTRTYDLFELRGLKLAGSVLYKTRPSSFQRIADEDEHLRGDLRLVYNLRGGGAIEVGGRQTHREEFRLTREGIERLLADPARPRADILPFRDQVYPTMQDAWLKATMRIHPRAKVFVSVDEQDLDGAPRTDWVERNSPTLAITNRRTLRGTLALLPFRDVDARLDASREERFLSGRGRHAAGQNQTIDHVNAHLRFGFLPRTRLDLDLGNHDLANVDQDVGADQVREVTNYRLEVGYDLTRRLILETSYQRLNYDGASGVMQELVEVAFDYGGTDTPAHIRVAYTADDFHDPDLAASSYRAQVVSVSGGMKF